MSVQYKLQISTMTNKPCAVTIIGQNISIPFDPANTDYANFKAQILNDKAELQDADGNLMTPQDAKDFVRTLP